MKATLPGSGHHSAPLSLYFVVALGSALGGTARWLVSTAMHGWLGAGFPWGTLLVNVAGSLLIGYYAALVAPEGRLLASPRQRHFVMTGFCGGFTTFSIFGYESVSIVQAGHVGLAGLNVLVSASAWLVAAWAGYALGTRTHRLRRA